MAISKDEVKYIAHLARLGLSEEEIKHFQTQLEVILQYIDQLKVLDVSQVEPMAHVLDVENVLRPDEPKASLDPESVLGISPSREKDFYKVPKVLE
ncbi:MAG: Asp-tRNA(Asn)/Glu-tRNA(Gln) amidotransferase subunit GatC [Candidatus Omnitrophota bacterium]